MRAWLQSNPYLLPALWLSAVPWLLFPTVAPPLTIAALLILLLLLFQFIPQSKLSSPLSLPATPINPYLLLFLLLTGLAYLLSPLPQVSLPKLTVTILGAVTLYLLLPRLNHTANVERLITALALCAGLIALAGFFTLEWPERQVFDLQPVTDRLPHLGGSFSINYNEMAGTLLFFFPFVLAALGNADGRLKKTFFLFNLFILLTLLFFTQSRGAIMGLAVVSLTWLLWGRLPLRKAMIIFVALGVVLLVAVLLMGLSLDDLLNWLSALDAGSKQGNAPANSWLTRIEIWRTAGRMLLDYPVFGAGLYTFDPVSRANYVYETILPSFNLTHAHSLLLQIGTSLGVSGLLALAGIWITTLVNLWQAGRSPDRQIRRLSAVFATSIAGYLFFNLYDTITFGQKPGLFVWIILAGGLSLSRVAEERSTATPFAPGRRPLLTLGKAAAFVPFLPLLILLLTPALQRNLSNLNLDRIYLGSETNLTITTADFPADIRRAGLASYLAGNTDQALSYWRQDPQGRAYLQSQGTIALTAGRIGTAIDWYNLALTLEPESAEAYLWRGVANEERGTIGLAEADFRRAAVYITVGDIDNDTKAYIYFRLGNLMAQQGRWQAAADAFVQATFYEPEESWYHRLLGDALTNLGDHNGAAKAYQRAER